MTIQQQIRLMMMLMMVASHQLRQSRQLRRTSPPPLPPPFEVPDQPPEGDGPLGPPAPPGPPEPPNLPPPVPPDPPQAIVAAGPAASSSDAAAPTDEDFEVHEFLRRGQWGCFTLTARKISALYPYGGYQARCLFHRLTRGSKPLHKMRNRHGGYKDTLYNSNDTFSIDDI